MATKKQTAKKTNGTSKAAKKVTAAKPKASAKANGKANGKTKPEVNGKKMSQLDAAAKVLTGAKEPMNAKELVEAMTSKGFWTSPAGKTPHATLSAALQREINVKGKESRFTKTGPGKFALAG